MSLWGWGVDLPDPGSAHPAPASPLIVSRSPPLRVGPLTASHPPVMGRTGGVGGVQDGARSRLCAHTRCGVTAHAPHSDKARGKAPLFPSRLPFSPSLRWGGDQTPRIHVEHRTFRPNIRLLEQIGRSEHAHRTSDVRFGGFVATERSTRGVSAPRRSEIGDRGRERARNGGAAGEKSPSWLYSGGEAMALADRGPRLRRHGVAAGPRCLAPRLGSAVRDAQ